MAGAGSRPVAVVTGAGQGIGRGCALALGRAGFDLALWDREGKRCGSCWPGWWLS